MYFSRDPSVVLSSPIFLLWLLLLLLYLPFAPAEPPIFVPASRFRFLATVSASHLLSLPPAANDMLLLYVSGAVRRVQRPLAACFYVLLYLSFKIKESINDWICQRGASLDDYDNVQNHYFERIKRQENLKAISVHSFSFSASTYIAYTTMLLCTTDLFARAKQNNFQFSIFKSR